LKVSVKGMKGNGADGRYRVQGLAQISAGRLATAMH